MQDDIEVSNKTSAYSV